LNHCGSFHERWIAFYNAMGQAGLEVDRKQCILDQDSELYGHIDWLIARLGRINKMPDAFVCANDFLAIHLMAALKQTGLSIPDDIKITGFDGTPQSAMVDPCLTTVGIPGPETGRMAADMLLNRIKNPALPYCWTRVRTTPVWRKSTGE
jgi:LacI family transcriptional regulator